MIKSVFFSPFHSRQCTCRHKHTHTHSTKPTPPAQNQHPSPSLHSDKTLQFCPAFWLKQLRVLAGKMDFSIILSNAGVYLGEKILPVCVSKYSLGRGSLQFSPKELNSSQAGGEDLKLSTQAEPAGWRLSPHSQGMTLMWTGTTEGVAKKLQRNKSLANVISWCQHKITPSNSHPTLSLLPLHCFKQGYHVHPKEQPSNAWGRADLCHGPGAGRADRNKAVSETQQIPAGFTNINISLSSAHLGLATWTLGAFLQAMVSYTALFHHPWNLFVLPKLGNKFCFDLHPCPVQHI